MKTSKSTESDGMVTAKPDWLRVRLGRGETFNLTRGRIRANALHTVCESAHCPNIGHCWSHGRATIMILGDRCTRGCTFCNVDRACVLPPDPDEPRRVAEAVRESALREVVLTSVTRDDLPDGGAALWAQTIAAVHQAVPGILVEVLVPDFQGDRKAIQSVLDADPEVFGHNLETVPRLYPAARPQADYARSLKVLEQANKAGAIVKTSLMLGMGETLAEIASVMRDAQAAGCRILYLGQYLRPSQRHLPVATYLTPETFTLLGDQARALGIAFVASAPLTRSSFHEVEQSRLVREWPNRSDGSACKPPASASDG